MFLGVRLSKSLWGKGGANIAYLVNKCQFTIINFKTHMEVFGKLIYYSNLIVFKALLFAPIKIV